MKSLDENIRKHDDYLVNCFLYIHQNPLRAGLVSNLEEWEFSSYLDYSGARNGSLCNKELAIDLLALPEGGSNFETFSQRTISDQFLKLL